MLFLRIGHKRLTQSTCWTNALKVGLDRFAASFDSWVDCGFPPRCPLFVHSPATHVSLNLFGEEKFDASILCFKGHCF